MNLPWLIEVGGVCVKDSFPVVFSGDVETQVWVEDPELTRWFIISNGIRMPVSIASKDDLRRILVAHKIWEPCPIYVTDQYSQMLVMALESGDERRAMACVECAFRTADQEQSTYIHDRTYLSTFISPKIANALETIGVYTVDDLDWLEPDDVLSISNVAETQLDLLIKELSQHDIQWPKD